MNSRLIVWAFIVVEVFIVMLMMIGIFVAPSETHRFAALIVGSFAIVCNGLGFFYVSNGINK